MCVVSPETLQSFQTGPGSVRVDLGTSFLVSEQGLQYKLNAHLRLNVFYDVPNFTRTEPEVCSATRNALPRGTCHAAHFVLKTTQQNGRTYCPGLTSISPFLGYGWTALNLSYPLR